MRFKIDRASLIDGSKFPVFTLFYFGCEGNFQSTSPQGAYIWRGDLTESFLRYRFGGPIFGGAYFRNFRVTVFEIGARLKLVSVPFSSLVLDIGHLEKSFPESIM